jgi:hypothetical protein|nr:MAG TPA: YopX protein [Bacteriophage sp.]
MFNFVNLQVKACEVDHPNKQAQGFYIPAVRNNKIEHRVVTGISQDMNLSENNPKFEQCVCVSYVNIDPNTLRRNTDLKDINGRILYERDILISDTGKLMRVEMMNDRPALILLEFDSAILSDIKYFIKKTQIRMVFRPIYENKSTKQKQRLIKSSLFYFYS